MRLEAQHETERPSCGAGIYISVDTAEHFGIKPFIFCYDKRVLHTEEYSQRGSVVPELREVVAESDVVATQERGIAQPVVRLISVGLEIIVNLEYVCQLVVAVESVERIRRGELMRIRSCRLKHGERIRDPSSCI